MNRSAVDTCAAPRVMRMPEKVDIEITARCNLRCRYCYYFDGDHRAYRDLPADAWLRFFDECGEARVMSVILAGGEPFMRDDLPDLIDGIVRGRMRFSILSNGTLIGDAVAARIAATGRCDCVQVSIDGPRPEIHDTFRGRGSFQRAVSGLGILRRHGVPVAVRTTVHRLNAASLEETARFLLDDLGLPSFSTNSACYFGSCRAASQDVLLGPEERSRTMKTFLRLDERYPGRLTAQAGPLAEARGWTRMEEARKGGEPPFDHGGRLTGCGCAFRSMAIRSDGTFTPCPMLPHIELGRLGENRLLDIWQNHPALHSLRARREIPLSSFEECRGCSYLPYCTGDCPGLAASLTGQVEGPCPDSCLRRFIAGGGTLP